MKRVTLKAVVDQDLCIGCKVCEKVCPVYAISVTDRKAHSDADKCMACANCADRCPRYAIKMVEREEPFEVGVDVSKFDYEKIRALCEKAHLNPEQVVCYCVGTRAWDIPEEVKEKYNSRGFYFDEDRELLDKIVKVRTDEEA